MAGAGESVFGQLARHAAKGGSVGVLTVALGDGVALFPGVAGGWDGWGSHISKASDDLSRLARNVFGQSFNLFSRDLRAGRGSSMTD